MGYYGENYSATPEAIELLRIKLMSPADEERDGD